MSLTKIIFNNFKNLKGSFDLDEGINIVLGNNGQGKTNFLEGIYYLSYGSGFGSSSDESNINWKSKNGFFRISGLTEDTNGESKVEVLYENTSQVGRKKFLINEISRTRKNFLGNISSVVFAPQSVDLVSGSPDGRRKALDDILSTLDFKYADSLTRYKSILRNRNKILANLSNNIGNSTELTYWNDALVEEGSYIIAKRINFFVDEIDEIAKKAKALFNGEFKGLNIFYQSKLFENQKNIKTEEITERFREKIKNNLEKEIRAASTLYGPHREDYEFRLENIFLRESGSRGQQRLASLIFILTVFDILKKKNNSTIVLLDDIMSELDFLHRANIEKMLLSKKSQIIITTAEEGNFTKEFLKKSRIIKL